MILGAVILMMVTEYRLAFTAIGSTLLGFVLMMLIVKTSQKYFNATRSISGDQRARRGDLCGHNIVKAYNAEKGAKKRFDEINGKLFDSNWKSSSCRDS
jgi:ATP-binding cassette subfamily B protein